ncbi:MAG: hypothetical protein ACREPE_08285 [Lysobacter sp.]
MAEVIVPLPVGDTEIRVAVDDDYLRTSEKVPKLHGVVAAGLPATNRLAEGFFSEADVKRIALGLPWQDTHLQVQLMRNLESLDFTQAEWEEGRPQVAKALGVIDINALLEKDAGVDARMSAAAGFKMSSKFGQLSTPELYESEGSSLRFVVLLPISVEAAGKSEQVTLECAGAVVRLSSKLVYLFAYRQHVDGNDTTEVRAALDLFVDRAIALNPDAPAS